MFSEELDLPPISIQALYDYKVRPIRLLTPTTIISIQALYDYKPQDTPPTSEDLYFNSSIVRL